MRLAFVGKPNVGKSSLVNRLLGEERVLVHDAPGTTRDPIDTPFSFGGREYVLVDTAGMRRRRAIDTLTEHVAAKMARDQIDRCDVAAMLEQPPEAEAVRRRHTEHLGDHGQRQGQGEVGHEIDDGLVRGGVQQVVGDLLDPLAQVLDPGGGEGLLYEVA